MRRVLITMAAFGLLATACDDGGENTADTSVTDTSDTATEDSTVVEDSTVTEDSTTDDSTIEDSTIADTAADTTDTDTSEPNLRTLSVTIGPFSVAPGEERTKCVSLDLGNVDPGLIRAIRTDLTPGSHHMIVHRLPGAAEPDATNCSAFAHGASSDLVFIAQSAKAELNYPPKSGLPAKANQTIGLEMHYINYFAEEAVDITGTVEFDIIDEAPGFEPVRVLFTGPLGFGLPPNKESTIEHFQSISPDWRIFALTSHTHQLGIEATIARSMSSNDDGTVIHESFNWAEAPLDTFSPLLSLDSGEGLKLTCNYDNTTNSWVTFGTGFEDEMCFMWVYYLP